MKLNQKNDAYWMTRTLRLASRGLGRSSPNPSVGACIVKDNQCIGQGVHVKSGSDHAEILALKDARAQGHDVSAATLFVSLEPCTTYGRTPPCSEAILAAGIKRVVVAMPDPFQDDAAAFFAQHNIQYEVGLLQDVAQHLHGGFIKRMQTSLPRITGKWAMTLDGYVATAEKQSQWISAQQALQVSRRRRRVFDAIVVGSGTFVDDNPRLLAAGNRHPRRFILAGKTIPDFTATNILQHLNDVPVYCFHKDVDQGRQQLAIKSGVELYSYETLTDVFKQLATLGCNDVLVEGGSQIHHACLDAGLYDRLEIYMGSRSLAGGLSVAGDSGAARIDIGQAWQLEQEPLCLGDSVCLRYALSGAAP